MKRAPRKIFVLNTEKISKPLDIFFVKSWVSANKIPIKIKKSSIENNPIVFEIIKNQNDIPAVTASDLKRGDEVCILNRIYESH